LSSSSHPNHLIFIFNAQAPRHATGPADPDIPETMPTFEWWGEPNKPYETAWMEGFGGFDTSLSDLIASGPYDGVIGFSQVLADYF